MGKRLIVQRRGRGTPTFKALDHKRIAPAKYPPVSEAERESSVAGIVENIMHEPGRGAPLAMIRMEDGTAWYTVAPEGLYVGQRIEMGVSAPVSIGNVLPLGAIPEGTMICNVERRPGDGGKLVRSSGAYATVVAHVSKGTIVKLPSKKTTCLKDDCRAMIGVVAAGGRTEKPFVKAGEKYHWKKAKGQVYPRVRGVAMTAASHPFGGGRHRHLGRPKTVSRHAPPGRKVGLIAAKATGRKKKRGRRK